MAATIPPASRVAAEILSKHNVSRTIIDHVCRIIKDVSFKGAGVPAIPLSLEGKIVQDADRLDAIGAIGIARAFAYGGYRGRPLYDPDIEPVLHASKEAYSQSQSPTINHFYEKLLLLKDLMNTETARSIAASRHRFMEDYLDRFYKEWGGVI